MINKPRKDDKLPGLDQKTIARDAAKGITDF